MDSRDHSPPIEEKDRLLSLYEMCGPAARLVVMSTAERLAANVGQGDFDDERDMLEEAFAESLDLGVYLLVGLRRSRSDSAELRRKLEQQDRVIARMVAAAAASRPAGLVYSTELDQ